MSSCKFKGTTLRRHKSSKPYERPKGIVATVSETVKNWVGPSSWFSWGEKEDQDPKTSCESFLPPPPGFLDGLTDNKLMMDESVGSKVEKDGRSSEEEMEDALYSPQNDLQSQSPQPLPAVSQIAPPLHKQMLFNSNIIVINRGASSSGGTTSSSSPSSYLSSHFISRSPFRSPYYSGRTSFGGMASKQKLSNKRTRPVDALPVRQTVKARQIAQDKRATTTSQLSQRILDTLQSLGSPLSDARKLPLRPAKRMKVDASVKDSSASVSSPTLPPPPVNPLLTINPPTSSLSRPSHRAAVTVSQSPVLSPPPSSSSPIKHYTPPTPQLSTATTTLSPCISMGKGGGGGKMKRDKQSLHFTRQPDQHNLNPSPLPPPISLSVLSSSPFSFPFSSPFPFVSASSSSVFSCGNIQLPTTKAPLLPLPNTSLSPFGVNKPPTATTSASSSFGFAKPKVLSGAAVSQTSSIKQGSPFQFSSPHHVTTASEKLPSAHQTLTSGITTSPTVQLNKPQKTSSPAPKPSSMSVLEVLKRPEYKLENIRKDAAAAAAAETIDLTSDDDEDEVVKEISKSKGKESVSITSASTMQAKPLALQSTTLSSSSWTCDDCWISNKDSSSSCVACGASKPGNKPASSSNPASGLFSSSKPSSTFNNSGPTLPCSSNTVPGSSNNSGPSTSSNPSSSWTCNDCWVNNKDTSLACVACGGKKPGNNPVATTVLAEGATLVSEGLSLFSGADGGFNLSSGGLLFGSPSTSSNASTTVSMQAAAPPSFMFSGSKQRPTMTAYSGGGLFAPQCILPAATTVIWTNSIFQPVASTPASSFNFSDGLGPAPFMFGQQTPANNPPTSTPSALFSSTPKINFAAQSGAGGGIFSQLAEQSQSGPSSMFQFSASSSLPQQPLAMGGGLPNTGNFIINARSVMQFGAIDGTVAAGSMFSAGLVGGGGAKRVIKKAARRKK